MSAHKPKLRMLKVIVHPILVIDDGKTLREFANQPSVIPANEWEDFPERLKADIAAIERQLANDEND